MAEYIKREAAMDIFGDVPMWDGYYEPYPFEVHCAIVGVVRLMKEELSKVATADVAQVVHGRWIKDDFLSDDVNNAEKCSQCGELIGWFGNLPNYCPNCGAKMDGGECE